jgi:dephospho-CoA kinase
LRVGLTGGIGAGKSTVSAFFAQLGAKIISSDKIAQQLLDRSDIQEQLIKIFGEAVVKSEITDRKYLSEQVFLDPALRLKLEALIHPEVRKEVESAFSQVADDEIAINEVPLLFEVDLVDKYDFVISVLAEKEERLNRAQARGLSRADAVARMSVQVEDKERISKSDFIIKNDSDLDALSRQVKEVWEQLLASVKQ